MQLCIINHLKQINMKNFILLWLVVLTGSLWAQATKTPEIVVPTIKGSDDYKATYYEEGRTYRAEEWLETYMQVLPLQHRHLPPPACSSDLLLN